MRGYALAVLIAFVTFLWAPAARAQLLSPGPLSKAHSSIEGDGHCNDCHASGKRIETQACFKCHGDLGARISAGEGLHGHEYRGKPCESCHAEHLGHTMKVVRWPGDDRKNLNHAQAGWPLVHAHATVPCDKCHTKTNTRGAKTYLGLAKTCTPCHKDPHSGRFGATCESCHNDIKWDQLKLEAFDHNLAKFVLRGAHQKVACAKCHHDEPPKYVGLPFAACTDCHKDPHAGKLGVTCATCHNETSWIQVKFPGGTHPGVSLGGGHAPVLCATCHDRGNKVAPSRGSECVSCHRPVHKAPFGRACIACHASIQWLGLPRSIGLSVHDKTAYPLTGKHEDKACSACHRAELSRNARFRQLKFGQCIDCHRDNHNGEFSKSNGGECAPCHLTFGFRPTLFGVTAHEQTKFSLSGKHEAVACVGCHTAPRPRVNLHLEKQTCAECHTNPHGSQFAAEMRQGGCAHCHETGGWRKPKFDHATWPLTGAHSTTSCDSCHHPTPEDRKAGKGASYRGLPRLCGGCHSDVHAGQFRTKALVPECDKCHTPKAFTIPNFDHVKIAGYALTGAHAKVKCTDCHPRTKLATGIETVRWRLPSNECRDCHANPHGGGFR